MRVLRSKLTATRSHRDWRTTSPTSCRLRDARSAAASGCRDISRRASRRWSTPWPAASPQNRRPSLERVVVREHLVSVSGACFMYSWMPKFGTQVSKCSAAPMHTGERSVAPWNPVRTLMQRREVRDAPHVRDAAAVHDGRADVVDELVLDEVLAVPDRVEHLAHRERRHRVLADRARTPSGFPPASQSSIQNSRYGSSDLAEPRGFDAA